MARTSTIPAKEVVEEIANIHDDHINKRLDIYVGVGTFTDGVFNFIVPQQFMPYHIAGKLYDELITKYPAYVENDLWEFIDIIRLEPTSPRLGVNYDWDAGSQSWIPNIDRAVKTALKAIEAQRDELRSMPIAVGGIEINGDNLSKDNLERKLMVLNSAAALGTTIPAEELMWHDVNNVDHAWSDISSYTAWIQSAAVALGSREALVFRKSFIHKSNIAALAQNPDRDAAVAAIEAYDVAAGWE
jgi:hypothetical protein